MFKRIAQCLGGLMVLVAGCVSLTTTVPLVGPAVIAQGESRGVTEATLQNGRRLYLMRCARCHTAVPIEKHTLGQWRKILPDMAEEARLSTSEERDITAYVLTMREMLLSLSSQTSPGSTPKSTPESIP